MVAISFTQAAAEYCTIIRPESTPGSVARYGLCATNWSKPETTQKVRRSEIPATCEQAMARRSSGIASGIPWKFPPETMSPSLFADGANTSGLSVTAPSSREIADSMKVNASSAAPSTCGVQRSE